MHAATVTLDVRCSKGTFIRTLAEDIGARWAAAPTSLALRRTGSGVLHVEGCVTLADALAPG